MARVDLNSVEFLDLSRPLFIFAGQFAVQSSLAEHPSVSGVELVTPPTAEDGALRPGLLSRDVHIVEHIEPASSTLKQVHPHGIAFCQRREQRRQTLFIAPR